MLLKIPTVDRLRTHYLKDLSEGGAFIRVANPMQVGAPLTVELLAPGMDKALTLRAKVVRRVEGGPGEPAGMAVKFELLEAEVEQRLRQLIEDNREQEPDSAVPLPSPSTFVATSQAPAVDAAPDVDRLRQQVQGLVLELGAAREAQAAAERRAEEAEERLTQRPSESLVPPADGGGTVLAAQLKDAQERVQALEEQLRALEQVEATSRALADKVAHEKARSEKQLREELARARAESDRVIAQNARATADELSKVHGEVERLQEALKRAEEQTKSATAILADERRLAEQRVKAEKETFEARVLELQSAMEQRLEATQGKLAETERRIAEQTSRVQALAAKEQALAAAEKEKARLGQELETRSQLLQAAERKVVEARADFERLQRREAALRQIVNVMTTANLPGADQAKLAEGDEITQSFGAPQREGGASEPARGGPVLEAAHLPLGAAAHEGPGNLPAAQELKTGAGDPWSLEPSRAGVPDPWSTEPPQAGAGEPAGSTDVRAFGPAEGHGAEAAAETAGQGELAASLDGASVEAAASVPLEPDPGLFESEVEVTEPSTASAADESDVLVDESGLGSEATETSTSTSALAAGVQDSAQAVAQGDWAIPDGSAAGADVLAFISAASTAGSAAVAPAPVADLPEFEVDVTER